ncbi:MAG: thiamine-phosphate kinase [Candidatus Caenarcaniphilales bacterium]|nr:thiamine-phosphate kinase [Candidatus Caenarcaniphilales bacterium]
MHEKEILQSIRAYLPEKSSQLIGDDCAYLEDRDLLISADALIEGVHFLSEIDPQDLGWKTAAVNLSDIAAMGGVPESFILTASLPAKCDKSWIEAFMEGLQACLETYSTSLIGGDLTRAEHISLSGTIFGRAVERGKVGRRSAARIGHQVGVYGDFGLSAGGLWAIQNRVDFPALKMTHLRPIPKIEAGQEIVRLNSGLIALMDSSDGLLDCLEQIATQSKSKLRIDLGLLTQSPELVKVAELAEIDFREWFLVGGEDYALVGTAEVLPGGWQRIGEVISGEGIEILCKGEPFDWQKFKSFEHFC